MVYTIGLLRDLLVKKDLFSKYDLDSCPLLIFPIKFTFNIRYYQLLPLALNTCRKFR
jgi:hypothetical protein